MGHDYGCGIAAECLANHFPWMHLCPIDRSLKQLYVFDRAMARIEEGRPKNFSLQSGQLVHEESARFRRIQERCITPASRDRWSDSNRIGVRSKPS